MHRMGLAHSDLSYNNVLVDPITKSASIIDIDGLVVPGLYPPEVIGTADFIAYEVLKTKSLKIDNPNRILPNQKTDLHALAVLIYMYLFRRQPLRGGKIWNLDSELDELLAMGENAIFIEHPTHNTTSPSCPFCGTKYKGSLPVLYLYFKFKDDTLKSEGHRLMIYHNQYLFKWHVSKKIIRNESLIENDKIPVGYFTFFNNKWALVNQSLKGMKDLTENKIVEINTMVELTDGKKILLTNEEGGRLLYITITNNK